MASIPYSLLLNQNDNILPISIIQDHQKFCRQFMKAHQTFEKYNKTKSKLAFINDNVFLFCKKKQNQEDILNWLSSLTIEEKRSILSIKNKWLVNIFSQLFYIYYKMGNYCFKPLGEMFIFFDDQKKYLNKNDNCNPFLPLFEILESKKISNKAHSKKESCINKNKEEKDYSCDESNLYSNYFEMKEIIDKEYLKSEKRENEKKFIECIRVMCSQKEEYDTITFTNEFMMDIDTIKKNLEYFSGDNYFKDWLMPINTKNMYNYVLPSWMQNNQELSLCQLIMGFFEQKIIINYEYYYYTKKIYELSYYKKINEFYSDNLELENFVVNNYSFNENNKGKEEILTLEKVIKIVDDLRGDEAFHERISIKKNLFNKVRSGKACYIGKEISFDDDLSSEIYHYLYKEILKEKDNNYISKLLELVSFIRFIDIINLKESVFYGIRKSIINSKENSVLDELKSDGFLQKKSNKKHKKKKKKTENENTDNKSNNKIEDKKNQNIIRTSQAVSVQIKECECEYNMNSRNSQFNMIQENATNLYIDSSHIKNNNHLFIQGTKKVENKEEKEKEEKNKNIIEIKKDDKNKEVKNEEKKEEKKRGKEGRKKGRKEGRKEGRKKRR